MTDFHARSQCASTETNVTTMAHVSAIRPAPERERPTPSTHLPPLAGMILPWIRRRSSGLARRAAARSGAVLPRPVLRVLEHCAPTATTRRYQA